MYLRFTKSTRCFVPYKPVDEWRDSIVRQTRKRVGHPPGCYAKKGNKSSHDGTRTLSEGRKEVDSSNLIEITESKSQ